MFKKLVFAHAASTFAFCYPVAANEVENTVRYLIEHTSPSAHMDNYAMTVSFEALAEGQAMCNESQSNVLSKYYFQVSQGVHIEANQDSDEFIEGWLLEIYHEYRQVAESTVNLAPILAVHERRHPSLLNFSDDKVTYNEFLVILGFNSKAEATILCQ